MARCDDVVAQIHDARLDETVAAVVLRVNSPGGAATSPSRCAGPWLWSRAMASPWWSAWGTWPPPEATGFQAPRIISSLRRAPSRFHWCLALGATFEDSAGALGVTTDGVQTHPLPGRPTPSGPLSFAPIQAGIDHTYAAFRARVAEGQGLTSEAVDALAEGGSGAVARPMTGSSLIRWAGWRTPLVRRPASRSLGLTACSASRNLSPLDAMLSAMLTVDLGGPRPSLGPLGTWLATFFQETQAVLDLDYRRAGVLVWCPRCDALTP